VRIVSLLPSTTEILVALGAGDQGVVRDGAPAHAVARLLHP
jgi:ABC-type hemin transport system substrate-binding protein